MPDRDKIKQDVMDHLRWDSRLSEAGIEVEVTDQGIVRLSGTAPTYSARLAASETARAVSGVAVVENEIMVTCRPAQVLSDEEIDSDVWMILDLNPDIDVADISVSVENGTVSLEGTVDSYWEKWKAEDLAGGVPGVRAIKNKLTVVPTGDYSDKAIADEIVAALDRNVNVDLRTINVKVEDGIVTLTGSVPNWTVYTAVREAARHTSGVKQVSDDLLVKHPDS